MGMISNTLAGRKTATPFQVIGHRGARVLNDHTAIAPENTIRALQTAANLNAAMELDVIATKDGAVVLHHDDDMGRLYQANSSEQRVRFLKYRELQEAAFHSAGHQATVEKMLGPGVQYQQSPACKNDKIPTLTEVIDAVPNRFLYVEIKALGIPKRERNQVERRVAEIFRQKNLYSRAMVISFNPWSLVQTRLADPKIQTGLDIELSPFLQKHPMLAAMFVKSLGASAILPPYEHVTPELTTAAHRLGLKIMPWVYRQTVSEEETFFPKLYQMGVDGIVTNAIERLQTFLQTQVPSQ